MNIISVGIDFNECNATERGSLSFTKKKRLAMLELLRRNHLNGMVLSTCNRTEVIVTGDIHLEDLRIVEEYFLSRIKYEHEKKLHVRIDRAAIEHLLKLACGFKSMVFGEDQILHQLREAYNFSLENGYSGKTLNHMMQSVFSFAKQMRSKTFISSKPISVSYTAVSYMKQSMLESPKKIMLVGVGNMGKLTLKYLLELNPEKVYVTNRTHHKLLIDLPDDPRLEIFDYHEREKYIPDVDLIVSTTASPHTIFKKEMFEGISKPLYILDLAIPRDVDVEVDLFSNIHRMDMDSVDLIIRNNMQERRESAQSVKDEIVKERDELYHWMITKDISTRFSQAKEVQQEISERFIEEMKNEGLDQKTMERIETVLCSVLREKLEKPLAKQKNELLQRINKYGL